MHEKKIIFKKNVILKYISYIPTYRPLKKVLIGDNLSSHLSVDVIDACRENHIEFVCLPANSTHIMQPLDVGVFGPMKNKWKNQLSKYREQNPALKLLNKLHFPAMLKGGTDTVIASLQVANLQTAKLT